MGPNEERLNSLAGHSGWKAPSFEHIRDTYAVLAQALDTFAGREVLLGKAGEAANESFRGLRDEFNELQDAVHKMEKVIDDANGDLRAASSRIQELPSNSVPYWVTYAAVSVGPVGTVFVPEMGRSFSSSTVARRYKAFLDDKREKAAGQQYEDVGVALESRGASVVNAARPASKR